MATEKKYKTFWSFYPYYLTEHADPICRGLHFAGTSLVFILLIAAIFLQKWSLMAWIPIAGYGFAWAGHFFFEKNKPATFQYPLFSLGSDFVMFWHILTFQIDQKLKDAQRSINS